MTRLIDADALLEKLEQNFETLTTVETLWHITNAPTIQREGWKLVPIEPTDDMVTAGMYCEESTDELYEEDVRAIYKDMIATAPTEV